MDFFVALESLPEKSTEAMQQIPDEHDTDDDLLASSQRYLSQLIAAPNPESQQPSTEDTPTIDYSSFTVNELREKLKTLGLPTNGKKADMIARMAAPNV